ncbi:MAG: 50S ribosomal protein L29 [Candidatus Aenigmarchaeota archaeon]|nr:50S ribosomal protein L29 [Candidatus Aenigmarchaeota archaeon]
MKIRETRKMKDEDLNKKLADTRLELMKEKGNVEMGGNVKNPGKIKMIRRDVARILTLKKEREKNR